MAADADALVSDTSSDADDRDELARGQELLVREMFASVWKFLPASVVCEAEVRQVIVGLFRSVSGPFCLCSVSLLTL